MGEKKHVVILIHGTFAGKKEDNGERWWQRGSIFWNSLACKLPQNVKLLESQPIFHWSLDFDSQHELWRGKNHNLYRHVASQNLFHYLTSFEKSKTPYHIVAHSHGGSVVWGALRIARLLQGKTNLNRTTDNLGKLKQIPPLQFLRSCTTLGTPYIRLENLKNPTLDPWIEDAKAISLPFISSFILTSSLSLIYGPYQWFMILGLYSLLFILSSIFLMPYSMKRMVPIKAAAMQANDEHIASFYDKCWLTIWSKDDEALNLLRGALELPKRKSKIAPSLPLIPQSEATFISRLLFLIEYTWIFLFDKLVLPYIDRVARKRLAAALLGLDFLQGINEVSPWPCDRIRVSKNLTDSSYNFLRMDADERLAQSAPRLRDVLTLFGEGMPIDEALALVFNAEQGELIHSSYLESSVVLQTIIDNITSTSKD
jgi:hypothetical protein